MEFFHKLVPVDINLAACISQHSADKLVVYKYVEQKPLYLGYFFPSEYDSGVKYPTLILIHGGSWISRKVFDDQPCWKGDYLGFLARYYAEKGFICVSVDYRLVQSSGQTPEYGLIDSYEDCCDAVEFIKTTSNSFGIDTDKLYLLGESAGGHLAACVSTFTYRKAFSFKCVFLINPITDLNDPRWNIYVPVQSCHPLLCNLSAKERSCFLSPMCHVEKATSTIILIHGDRDSLVGPIHSKGFYQKRLLYSHSCDLHILEETNHAFLLAEFSDNVNACKMGIQIINSYLLS